MVSLDLFEPSRRRVKVRDCGFPRRSRFAPCEPGGAIADHAPWNRGLQSERAEAAQVTELNSRAHSSASPAWERCATRRVLSIGSVGALVLRQAVALDDRDAIRAVPAARIRQYRAHG
jgi:hypothetical protein